MSSKIDTHAARPPSAPPAFLPVRPINQADPTSLTERVRRRVFRWFKLARLRDAAAAADMLAWENSGFSVDASLRIALLDRDVPSYFQSLEDLLPYCARPPFALERLSVIRGPDSRVASIRYVLPRHKAANWVGLGRGRTSTRPGANGVVELSPFEFLDRLADLVARGPPTAWGELVQAHDDRDVLQSSPDEVPAIDIHSL